MSFQTVAPDIQCDGCANSIKRSLGKLTGVQNVMVDVAAKQVTVQYDPALVSEDAVRARLAAAGFPASGETSIPLRA